MSCPDQNCLTPCQVDATNTTACESSSSQIENFTKQFFGEVAKTEVNGAVTWVLPCDLDIGLENNQRASDEGLACYFLRLFRDGIIGLTGSPGATGDPGADGLDPFTVTVLSFQQPSLVSPTVTVKTLFNPILAEGMNVFIETSGWYNVDTLDTTGYLYLTLTAALSGAPSTIPAGKKVIPAGYPGQPGVGIQGQQGTPGATGAPGTNYTTANGFYYTSAGTDDLLANTPTAVTFISSSPALLLPAAGTYLLTATVSVEGQVGIATNDFVTASFYNTTIAGAVPGSSQTVNNLVDTGRTQIILSALYSTAGANQTVALYADCTTSAAAAIVAANTTMSYVRLG